MSEVHSNHVSIIEIIEHLVTHLIMDQSNQNLRKIIHPHGKRSFSDEELVLLFQKWKTTEKKQK